MTVIAAVNTFKMSNYVPVVHRSLHYSAWQRERRPMHASNTYCSGTLFLANNDNRNVCIWAAHMVSTLAFGGMFSFSFPNVASGWDLSVAAAALVCNGHNVRVHP